MSKYLSLAAVIVVGIGGAASAQPAPPMQIGKLEGGSLAIATKDQAGWGVAIEQAGMASARQPNPVQVEFFEAPDRLRHVSVGYQNVQRIPGGISGVARVAGPDKSAFEIKDDWTVVGDELSVSRDVRVLGVSTQGFLTSITLSHSKTYSRDDVEYFAPGMIYGGTSHLTPVAIGGVDSYKEGGTGVVQIREDRLPAPLFGIRFPDSSSLTVLDPTPNGATTKADSHDTEAQTLVDDRFLFGAVGAHLADGHHEQGFWFPGTEGEVTYKGNTYPGGQLHLWRRRYHPIRDGFSQTYRVVFRVSRDDSFPGYMQAAWRWAYGQLNPPIHWRNLPALEEGLVDALASQVETKGALAGIPNFVAATPDETRAPARRACMGFTGKQLETAELLLASAQRDEDAKRSAKDRELGLRLIQSFLALRMDPPIGECFNLGTGEPEVAIPRDHRVYLRSFSDDMKATLRAYHREKEGGHSHPDWLAWVRQYADWLLTQQQEEGGFPRAWHPGSGEIVDGSPLSSYNPIPMLVLLSSETGDPRYERAAENAGNFAWNHGQAQGQFVGGTIDNPDILDKEAGTLSMEAYLALYGATKNAQWLDRAEAAANYAETYIYLWNVPMAADEDNASLHWKRGVPTYGTQLIATGHSLTDEFMAFNVADYARLSRLAHDNHYLDVATLLLHDTKSMTAVEGATFDLNGPGWQQEHWSFAPVRGYGLHRGWLPWVATSQLVGMVALREYDPALYKALSSPQTGESGK